MQDVFNPYREWLGWEHSRAPDYYELLAVDRGELDKARIALAAEQAMSKVRSFRPGPQAAVWSRLLDEIRAARDCLSDPALRADYDAALARSDRFRSSAGDLHSDPAAALLPPSSWSAGPAPIYDSQHGVVGAPTVPHSSPGPAHALPAPIPVRHALQPTAALELPAAIPVHPMAPVAAPYVPAPMPQPIDDLLPPGMDAAAFPSADNIGTPQPASGHVAVPSVPSVASVMTARRRKKSSGLVVALISSVLLLVIVAAAILLKSPRARETADASKVAIDMPTVATGDETNPAAGHEETAQPTIPIVTPIPKPEPPAATPKASNISPPETPATSVPPRSTAEQRAKLQALTRALETAKAALGEQNFTLADEQLKRAESLAETSKHKAAVARLSEIAGYVKQFRTAVAAAVQSMQAAETFKVGNSPEVAFVEAFPDKVTLHVTGTNKTYAFSELPPGLALAFADRKLPARNPMSAVIKGAYLAIHKQDDSRTRERAKQFWEEAEAGGANAARLMEFFSDNYADFVNDTTEPP